MTASSDTASNSSATKPEALWVYVGTYTQRQSQGIYRLRLDLATGKLTAAECAAHLVNPSFLAVHPNGRFLYSVNEVGEMAGHRCGAVSALMVEPRTGELTFLDHQLTKGAGPCHLSVDPQGKTVLAANYGGGSVVAFPIGADGRVGEASAFIQHHGSSVNKQRQEGPHAHSINVDATGHFAYAADLGLDQVLIYRLDAAKGTLTPNHPPAATVAPGAGPRHFAFHPSGRWAYVINELDSTVTAFGCDAKTGALKTLQTISTLPEGFHGQSWTAEVRVHPSGKFLYGSNRGHDSIAVFTIDPETGRLTAAGHTATRGKTPRNFGIDPTGTYLLAANQDTDTLVLFRIDPKTGQLTPTGEVASVPMPVCVKMIPVAP